jgi:acyl-CoA reductase-like NAD-dependent aldehyde dehydrogenase
VFVDSLVRQASAVRINHPDIRHGHIGPLIFERQASVIQTHLDDAVARGAEIRCGGELIRHGGIWCPPTVLTGVDHRMKVMTEETFGPVLPVMVYDEVEAAIRLANDTEYGLSGAVFAGNVDEGVAVARHIDGGAISVNDASLTAMVHEVEHDSFRRSGMGRSRMGASGVARYFRRKALLINRGYAAGIDDYAEPGDRG